MKLSYDKEGIETNASIKREIAELFGFSTSKIILMEATYQKLGDTGNAICTSVDFQVCGIGYSADLCSETLDFAPIWNK